MKEAVKKAKVLLEALPYIQDFNGKIFVIKYGGSALENETVRKSVLQDIVFMHFVGIKAVLVHGGGPNITKALKEKGIKVKFINGLRYTDLKTMRIVRSQLCKLNSLLVKELKEMNCPAKSLNYKDAIIKARRKSKELGWVGEIIGINTNPIFSLLAKNIIPVISPLGVDRKMNVYNVNADLSSADIASALGAEKLVFLTNVDGIMYNNRLLSSVDLVKIKKLIEIGVISGGMLPKVEAGIIALEKGVRKVHIVNAGLRHALLLEIFTKKGIGTELVMEVV